MSGDNANAMIFMYSIISLNRKLPMMHVKYFTGLLVTCVGVELHTICLRPMDEIKWLITACGRG